MLAHDTVHGTRDKARHSTRHSSRRHTRRGAPHLRGYRVGPVIEDGVKTVALSCMQTQMYAHGGGRSGDCGIGRSTQISLGIRLRLQAQETDQA